MVRRWAVHLCSSHSALGSLLVGRQQLLMVSPCFLLLPWWPVHLHLPRLVVVNCFRNWTLAFVSCLKTKNRAIANIFISSFNLFALTRQNSMQNSWHPLGCTIRWYWGVPCYRRQRRQKWVLYLAPCVALCCVGLCWVVLCCFFFFKCLPWISRYHFFNFRRFQL